MLTYLIFIVAYLISALLVFRFIRLSHYHPRGIWNGLHPDGFDKFLTFMPFVNILAAFVLWILFKPYKRTEKEKENNMFNPNRK